MRIGTRILLVMLLVTVGSSALVSWIVTLNVTSYETARANGEISQAIGGYVRHLEDEYEQVSRIVRAMLEAPAQRSLLQAASDSSDRSSLEQLRQEVLGRDVQGELRTSRGSPAFHVLVNLAGEVMLVSSADGRLAPILSSDEVRWPVDAVLGSSGGSRMQYVATPGGLFLTMGVPLRTQLDQPPDNAYFAGFRIDDNWVRQQLMADRASDADGAPLAAWFVMEDKVLARASSDPGDATSKAFGAGTALRAGTHGAAGGVAADPVEFDAGGEHFVGQAFSLDPGDAKAGRLILASSMDRALAPLRRLQRDILLIALGLGVIAVVLCRAIAVMIARPIHELVEGTQRIAAGRFDTTVKAHRRHELGKLGEHFNQMAQGLMERDTLREERFKIERDLAVARKIQMDVLPRKLPPCPGYDMAAYSLPAEATGGDIYDLVGLALDPLSESEAPSVVLLLADATGHGIGPALSVTQVRSMLRIGMRLRAGLDEVFSQINRQLCQDLDSGRFVTAFLGLLDPSAHSIKYHSAGQGPLLHYHAATRELEWLDSSMLPLGIKEDAMSEGEQKMQVEPGDFIVLLTDGFYECHNRENELFGKERVAEIILRHHREPAREMLKALVDATHAFADGAPQADDMTAVIIRRLPAEDAAAVI